MKRFTQYYLGFLIVFLPMAFIYGTIVQKLEIPPWVGITLFGFIGVVGVGVAISGVFGERAVRHLASQLGWRYARSGSLTDIQGFTRYPFVGSSKSVGYLIWGNWRGRKARWFLYGAGGAGGGHILYIVNLPERLPTIELVPRALRGYGALLGNDLETESGEFNSRWRVMCTDLRYAHAVLHPRMMERLLEPGADSVAITIEGGKVYAAHPNVKTVLKTVPARFDLLSDAIDLIPPHVWREFGGTKSLPTLQDGVALAISQTVASHEVVRPPDFAKVNDRTKNLQGRLAILLPFTLFLAPIGVVMGHRALRSVRLGDANNPKTAIAGIIFGWLMSVLFVLSMVAMFLTDA